MNSGGNDDGIGSNATVATSLSATNTSYSGGNDDGDGNVATSSVSLNAATAYSGGIDDGTSTINASALPLVATSMFGGGTDDGFNLNNASGLSFNAATNYAGGADDGTSGLLVSSLSLATNSMFAGDINDGVSSIAVSTLNMATDGMYAGGTDDGYGSVTSSALSIVVLPITWEEFGVTRSGTDALLFWKVGTERNDAGFEIERSYDGFQFLKIGFVKAKNSTLSENEYSYTDDAPALACPSANCTEVYYRLRQIDVDQKFSFSPIRKLKLDALPLAANIYPNPASSQLFVQINATRATVLSYDLQLYNSMGMLVEKHMQLAANLYALNVQELASGIYYLKLSIDGQIYSYRISITH